MKPDFSKLPGGWDDPDINFTFGKTKIDVEQLPVGDSVLLKNVLSPEDCFSLITLMNSAPKIESVSVQGMVQGGFYNDQIGSERVSIWSQHLANQLWNKFQGLISIKECHPFTSTDFWQQSEWCNYQPIGVSPLLRFMRYIDGGQHFPHYDAGYIYPNNPRRRTLKSFVIYLTSNNSGATRFIKDIQSVMKIWDRNHSDWEREPTPQEIEYAQNPIQGFVLMFDHRLCHDVELYKGDNPRIIIRGDIIYKGI